MPVTGPSSRPAINSAMIDGTGCARRRRAAKKRRPADPDAHQIAYNAARISIADLAHLVEQLICNHQVASSKPAVGTNIIKGLQRCRPFSLGRVDDFGTLMFEGGIGRGSFFSASDAYVANVCTIG